MQVLSVRGAQESASGLSCVVQTHDGDGLDGHRVSRTHDSEICFACCARPKLGLRAGPATPHRNRAYGHETSPQRGCCSPVRCLDLTAASARRSEYDSAAAVVGSNRTLTLNVEMASSMVKS